MVADRSQISNHVPSPQVEAMTNATWARGKETRNEATNEANEGIVPTTGFPTTHPTGSIRVSVTPSFTHSNAPSRAPSNSPSVDSTPSATTSNSSIDGSITTPLRQTIRNISNGSVSNDINNPNLSAIKNTADADLIARMIDLSFQEYETWDFSTGTGNGSTWEALPDNLLTSYLTDTELDGIQTKTCGNVVSDDKSHRWQYLGQTKNFSPCCPNGHLYGWFGRALNDTSSLVDVEVTSEGKRMPPFQMNYLLKALQAKRGPKEEYTIGIYGDSTGRQFFYGFLCGFARVGGTNIECKSADKSAHYWHPLCERASKGSLFQNSTTSAKIHFEADGVLHKQPVTYNLLFYTDSNLTIPASPPPDIFLFNAGVHTKTSVQLRSFMGKMLDWFGNDRMLPSLVWRGTTIQHFPSADGSYEAANFNSSNLDELACGDTPALLSKNLMRHETPREFFAERGLQHIPFLDMTEAELHNYKPYPLSFLKKGVARVDCTHRVYTPLYFDSVFRRLGEIILPITNNNSEDNNGQKK